MPELPEVQTILIGLRAALEGRRIISTEVRNDLRWPVPDDLSIRADGKKIRSSSRLGKYMMIALVRGPTLLIHLGMSGRIRITPQKRKRASYTPMRHEHVTLTLDNGTSIGLVDPRRFGCFLIIDAGKEREHPLLRALGADPLLPGFDASYLIEKLANKRSPIKTVLLDQRVVAGLGNIYVSEILFRARINPERRAASLDPEEIARIAEVTPGVLEEAIGAGGSTCVTMWTQKAIRVRFRSCIRYMAVRGSLALHARVILPVTGSGVWCSQAGRVSIVRDCNHHFL